MLILFVLFIVTIQQQCSSGTMLVAVHPHLDAFWLNSDKQLTDLNFKPQGFLYDMNQRPSKQIYQSMLNAMDESHRRFFTSETFFFKDWYLWLNKTRRNQVKELLLNGQFELVNGWIENDEATCYYDDIIEQYTISNNYMYQQFGYVNQIAWATDSFGHSHSQVALLHQLGFVMQGIERVDQRYIHQREGGPLLEFYWVAKSDSNNRTYGGLLTHLRHFLHEVNSYRYPKNSSEEQLQNKINADKLEFSKLTEAMQKLYGKSLLFRFLGNDFEEYLPEEFANLERIFKQLNTRTKCQFYRYGNPTQYMLAIQQYWTNHIVPSRSFDLMPNWDHDRYWTGFYTTYPTLKKTVKESSQILNFFKKALIRAYARKNITSIDSYLPIVIKSQETLAEMQHHDGITATAKHWIEQQMINRLREGDSNLIKQFESLYGIDDHLTTCNFIKNSYQCEVKKVQNKFCVVIYNFGTPRSQTVEVIFPYSQYFVLKNHAQTEYDIFCIENTRCRLIFVAALSGVQNIFHFEQVRMGQIKNQLISPVNDISSTYQNNVHFRQDANVFVYEALQQKITLSYQWAKPIKQARNTTDYTKFNTVTIKRQYPQSGAYIMFNDGQLIPEGGNITQMHIFKGNRFLRIVLKIQSLLQSTITINSRSLLQLNVKTVYSPKADNRLRDVFLRVWAANIVHNNQFYHDSNGYLVAKRILNQRPDYKIPLVANDILNSNTYPVTSFIYIKDGRNKLVVGNDRSQGGTLFNNSILLNIDRITGEDGKGLGQQYKFFETNTFNHHIAVVNPESDIERRWQKNRDQAVVAYFGISNLTSKINENQQDCSMLKYTIALLSEHSIVIRLQNVAEFNQLALHFQTSDGRLKIPCLDLVVEFKDLKPSYLNGLPIIPKYSWQNKSAKTVVSQSTTLLLQPLQIQSYLIDFTEHIKSYTTHAGRIRTQQEKQQDAVVSDSFGLMNRVKKMVRIHQTDQ